MPSSIRRPLTRAGALLASLALATFARSAPARADDVGDCAAASEDGELLRIKGHLRDARSKFLSCARPVCPDVIRRDCNQWVSEVDASLPTVVLGARDAALHDLAAVRVWLDGVLLVDRLDGKAFPIDAGDHVVRFEMEGRAPIEENVIIREGEKNRPLTVTFAAPDVGTQKHGGGHVAAYVLGGLGIAALGVAGVFEVASLDDYASLKNRCAPTQTCSPASVDATQRNRYVAAGSLGLGVVSLGVATWLFLRRPPQGADRPAVAVDIGPILGGGLASARVSF